MQVGERLPESGARTEVGPPDSCLVEPTVRELDPRMRFYPIALVLLVGCGDLSETSGNEGTDADGTGPATVGSSGPNPTGVTSEPNSESSSGSTPTEDGSASTVEIGSSDGTVGDTDLGTTGGENCVPDGCGMDVCGIVEQCDEAVDCGPCIEPIPIDQLEPEHILADPARNRIYATVSGGAPALANQLVVIDPTTEMAVDAVPMGSNPSYLAMSDDASTLWVGLDGSYEIRVVDLTTSTPTPGESYNLPLGQFGDLTVARDMVVLSGTTTSVAVSLHRIGSSPSFAGVAVLDDGVPRPGMTSGHTGASQLTGGPDGWLFGYNDLHTGFGFYAIEVTASGLSQTEHVSPLSGFNTDISHVDGRVYGTSGQVVDVSSPQAPQAAGAFAWFGEILVRPDDGDALMLSPPDFGESASMLRRLDPVTFTQLEYVELPASDFVSFDDMTSADGELIAVIGGQGFGVPSQLLIFADPF